jgi:radical SAM protein with 4Fe4S-binding SPASM domain
MSYNKETIKNIGINDKSKFKKAVEENKFYSPLFVKIKPSGKCNLKCIKCNYWRKDSHMFHPGLSFEKVISLVNNLSEMGCKCIKLSGGEITLMNNLFEIIKHIKSKNISCSITSNGYLINGNFAESLVKAGLDKITISIDSFKPEVHDYVVGVPGALDKSSNALKNLKEAKTKFDSDLRITVATVLTKLNYKDILEFLEYLTRLGVDRLDFLVLVGGHLKDSSFEMSKQEIEFFNKILLPKIHSRAKELGLYLVNPDPFRTSLGKNIKNVPHEIYEKIPCYVPWYSFLIHFNGEVSLCCANKEFKVGNVNEDSLSDILDNERSQSFRRHMKSCAMLKNCSICYDEIQRNLDISEWLGEKDEAQ